MKTKMQIEMEYLNIILQVLPYLVGGGGIIAAIIYRKQNKRMKEAEAKVAESNANQQAISTQSQEIDLGAKFMRESIAMLNQIKELQDTNNADTSKIVERIDLVEKKMANMTRSVTGYNKRLGQVERYLNGQYKAFQEQEKQTKK